MRSSVVALLVAVFGAVGTALAQAETPAVGVEQARRALEAERGAEALRILRPLAESPKASSEVLVLLSTAQFMVGDIDAGRATLDRALEVDPGNRQAWLNRAALDMSEGRHDEALIALHKARELDPAAPDNELNIGAVLVLKGEVGQASRHFNRYLSANRSSAEAYYLVASNYALASRWDLAVQHLEASVRLDERMRRRARVDPNFGALGTYEPFQLLLATDSYHPPVGSHRHRELFEEAYDGSRGPLLKAVLNALQFSGQTFDPAVEVTDQWALVWSDIRLKLSNAPEGGGQIEMSAPADRMTSPQWDARRTALLEEIREQLALLGMKRR